MAYDPDLPVNNSPISSDELRGQFQGLKEEIDTRATTDQLTNTAADLTTQLNDQITNETAGTFASVADFDLTVSDPPTQAEVQAIADRLHEVINAGKRV